MTYDTAFTALADPTRRRAFELLAANPSSVGALSAKLPVSRPAVSQHLKVLSDAGLVTVRSEGTRRIYSASTDRLSDLRDWLDRMWGSALAAYAEAAEREARK
ncbi:MAG: winged helix-turn-helix transcriptional regulator [Silicimonas sp.]|nr:winged helix-turn-helix transcriptional regulator [Silicimonas sp.]NND22567.1 winged helix-turn-helix transcriptional regulator [Silicimonas sp.]NNF90832.1 winged helix-turn-helix transcriptional regulator [Boseongicola sp.]NNL72453.1 winged helix-turn-helix transcriptional regulator [Silicimonas sp.]RZW05726.1 MAG: ArsR family transcriptional regulator [Paracoccaceae bacterium]